MMALPDWKALLATLAILLALWGWTYLWARFLRWRYRLRVDRPSLARVRTADAWELAVFHRPAAVRRYREPVLLCHGLAANHTFFDFEPPHSVAHLLTEAGFDCFSVDWRGTGASKRPPPGRHWSDYSVDEHIAFDGPALLQEALARTGAPRAFWLGHSLGGLIGYGVAQGPHGDKLAGLLTLGSPVYFHASTLLRAAASLGGYVSWPWSLPHRLFGAPLVPLLGYVLLPFASLISNPRHISPGLQRRVMMNLASSMGHRTLVQLKDWVLNDAFRSFDRRTDYREAIARLQLPLLVMAGSRDLIAPPEMAERQVRLAGSKDKQLVVFGKAYGHAQDYGHGDLTFGNGAPAEVFPVILEWLAARATRE